MTTLSVATANIHNAMGVDQVVKLRADLIGIQEGHKVLRRLEARDKYRLVVDRDAGQWACEVPILVTDRLPHTGSGSRFAAPDLGTSITKPRGWTRAMIPGWAMFNTHLHAVLQRDNGQPIDAPRVKAAASHMTQLGEAIKTAQADGNRVLVTGDFNYRYKGEVTKARQMPAWAPHRMFPSLGLTYEPHGLDGIAYPKGCTVKKKRIIPTSENKSDHAWIVLTLQFD